MAPKTRNRPETRRLGLRTSGRSKPETEEPRMGPTRAGQVRSKPEMTTRQVPWGLDRELA